jgi:hypothetical protein
MITRREVLREVRRLGLRKFLEIKQGYGEYENYLPAFYDPKIIKRGEERPPSQSLNRNLSSL